MRLRLLQLTACSTVSLLVAMPAIARELRLWPLLDYRSNAAGHHALDLLGPLLSWRSRPDHDKIVVRPLFSYVRNRRDRSFTLLYPLFDLRWNDERTRLRALGLGAIDQYTVENDRGWTDRVRLPPLLFYRGGGKQRTSFAFVPLYADVGQAFGQDRIRSILFPLYFAVDKDGTRRTWAPFPLLSVLHGENARGFGVWPLGGWQKRAQEHSSYALWPLYQRRIEPDAAGQLVEQVSIRPFYSSSDSPTLHSRLYFGFGRTVDRAAAKERWDFPWPLWHRERSISSGEIDRLNLRPFVVRSTTQTVSTGSVLWPLYSWQTQNAGDYAHASRRVLWGLWRWQQESGAETDEARLHTLFPLFVERQHGREGHLVAPALLDALFPESRHVERLYGPLWRLYSERRRGGQRSWSVLWGLLGSDGRRLRYPLACHWESRR